MTTSQKQQRTKLAYWAQLAAALIGMLTSLYLLVQHTRLKSGIQGGASFCTLGAHFNCDLVNVSRFAELGGIPIAAFGALYFFLLVIMGLMAPPSDKKFGKVQLAIAWLNVAALVVDAFLFVVQVFSLSNVCLMCLLTYVATLAVLALNIFMAAPREATFREKLKLTFSKERASAGRFHTPSLILAALGAGGYVSLLFMIPSFVRTSSPTTAHVQDALVQFYEAWKTMPIRKLEVKPDDSTFGNPNSRVQVVVFSDFQCPFCKKGAFTMMTALQPLKDRIYFVFKNFPLDPSCNPLLKYKLHAHACDLAKLGYCAHRQGKFWDFHDRVFFNMTEADLDKGNDFIQSSLKDIFTKEQFDACLNDPSALADVSEDIKLGSYLGVKGTPSVFINGKLVTIPLTVENLQKLVSLEEGPSS